MYSEGDIRRMRIAVNLFLQNSRYQEGSTALNITLVIVSVSFSGLELEDPAWSLFEGYVGSRDVCVRHITFRFTEAARDFETNG